MRICRKSLSVLAFAALFAAAATAQITPSLSCVSNAGTTPLVRSQGVAELIGDVVLNCTGGVPTPAGQPVPQVSIQVFLNTTITSRLVASPLSEALILIDDPAPANQIPCVPTSGPSCVVTGTGAWTGVNFKSGGVPNVWQGHNGGANSIAWSGVPMDPPGTNGTRTIRITNIRADASRLGTSTTLIPTQIIMFISINPPQSLPLANPQQTVAFVANGLSFSLRKPDQGDEATFIARFREGFANSFRRRNISVATTSTGAIDVNVSPAPFAQDAPGGVCSSGTPLPDTYLQCPANNYFTETGFYNPNFPTANGLRGAGLTDTGTRLILRFNHIPHGLVPRVPVVDTSGKARLISTDANGNGVFNPVVATTSDGYVSVLMTNGAGYVVYEVMKGDPLASEDVLVPVIFTEAEDTRGHPAVPALPALAKGMIEGGFAPLSTVTTQSSSAPLPAFLPTLLVSPITYFKP